MIHQVFAKPPPRLLEGSRCPELEFLAGMLFSHQNQRKRIKPGSPNTVNYAHILCCPAFN
jgi:hypothetical protein